MNNCYCPLHVHSYYSLLDGLPSPRKIAERAKEIGSPAIAITDHGNIFAMVDHHNACKKVGIKPISGIELYLCLQDPTIRKPENKKRYHLTILAKNARGIETLMALVSETNRPDFFYHKPRIDLEKLKPFASEKNLLCLSGCIAGELSESLFESMHDACLVGGQTNSHKEVKRLLVDNWQDEAAKIIKKYQQIFGKDNYYIELQEEGMIAQQVVVECLRQIASDLKVPTVATLDAHYTCQKDADDHRILLYSQMHTTAEQQEQMKKSGGDVMAFFYLDQFHIFNYDEMRSHYTQQEIDASLEIADKVKAINLGRNPCLPKFADPIMERKQLGSNQYLKKLCINNAKTKLADLTKEKKKEYWERLKRELFVIHEAGLADYFLIVWDVCKFVDKHKGPRGKGRGSGAGCLVNYLLGITGIDPIEYELYFERFYNVSRNIPPHFDFAHLTFMDWYADNFERLQSMDIGKARRTLAQMAGKTGRISDRLKAEARWIDTNNPKMWLYLYEFAHTITNGNNAVNSHVAWSAGMTDDINLKYDVKTHPGHISLPDIDTDIGVAFRSKVIDYLNERWGTDYVAQMITFGRLQGKAALKEVFRAQPDVVKHLMKVKATKEGKDPNDIHVTPFDLCNDITGYIPDEAAIIDELQQFRRENDDPDYGILRWAIDNIEEIQKFYECYRPLFDQAIRIEGTKKSQSKHAAGVVIANQPIKELVPLTYDTRSKDRVVGLEMSNAEEMGVVKFDFLGVAALDKLWHGQKLINQIQDHTTIDEDYKEKEE